MKENKFKNYIIFWLSQSVSQLGSSMTGYALIIWAYKQTNSAMCSFSVLVLVFVGSLKLWHIYMVIGRAVNLTCMCDLRLYFLINVIK